MIRSVWFVMLTAVAVLLTAGCSNYTKIPLEPQVIGDAYRVTPDTAWSRFDEVDHTLWTIDGELLEAVHLYAGVADEEALMANVKDEASEVRDMPVFRKGMRAPDVADLVAATFQKTYQREALVENLRPAVFGNLQGFRFEVAYKAANGLRLRADCLGAVTESGKLHLIVYEAAEEHYYEARHPRVEAIFNSVQVI